MLQRPLLILCIALLSTQPLVLALPGNSVAALIPSSTTPRLIPRSPSHSRSENRSSLRRSRKDSVRDLARGLGEDLARRSVQSGEGRPDLQLSRGLGQKRRDGSGPIGVARSEESRSLGKRANLTGSVVELASDSEGIYTIPLQIGTPSLIYTLQLDTASSDLLIASTLCTTSSCPYAPSSGLYSPASSTSWAEVNGNATTFNATFGDGSWGSGWLGLESIGVLNSWVSTNSSSGVTSLNSTVLPEVDMLDGFELRNQVLGLVNATTLNLKGEGIAGLLGLGFPRGTVLGRALASYEGLADVTTLSAASGSGAATTSLSVVSGSSESQTAASSQSSSTATASLPDGAQATASSQPATDSSTTPYYPTLLENLFSTDLLYYPVFSLALSNSSSPFSSKTDYASITFGGVSAVFVLPENENTTSSGRTVADIEWWDVVPFARATLTTSTSASAESTGATSTTQASATTSATSSAPSAAPTNWLTDLEGEEYLYWALELSNVTVNGTNVPLTPTYNSSVTGLSSSVALLDVGTNGIYGPQQDLVELFSMIEDARVVSDGQWAVPCATSQTLTFQFGSGGRVVELQPSEWLIGGIVNSEMCLAWPVAQAPSADGVDWQLGTPFLRKVYTVFGYGIDGVQSPVIGFLPLPDGGNTTATSTATASATGQASATGVTTNTSATSSPSTTTRDLTNPTPVSVQDSSEILAALTITFGTTLPNEVLPNPTSTTPPYAFETTSIPTLGQAQTIGLANATAYPAILDVQIISPSAVAVITTGTGTTTIRGLETVSAAATASSSNSRPVMAPALRSGVAGLSLLGGFLVACFLS